LFLSHPPPPTLLVQTRVQVQYLEQDRCHKHQDGGWQASFSPEKIATPALLDIHKHFYRYCATSLNYLLCLSSAWLFSIRIFQHLFVFFFYLITLTSFFDFLCLSLSFDFVIFLSVIMSCLPYFFVILFSCRTFLNLLLTSSSFLHYSSLFFSHSFFSTLYFLVWLLIRILYLFLLPNLHLLASTSLPVYPLMPCSTYSSSFLYWS
jgi:hypothetical protein